MEITIKGTNTITEVKDQFHDRFENLKIEFFHHSHDVGEGSPAKDMVKGDTPLNDIRESDQEGTLTYTEDMKISDFEQLFENDYGLHIQIFRHASKAWLETVNTDHWTLKEANVRAKEMYQSQ